MSKYGLIGESLKHSFSKDYFTNKFENLGLKQFVYENFEIENTKNLHDLILTKDLSGLNVTIPFKESVMAQLDALDELASKIGAVNTIQITKIEDNIFLKGFNTDAYGFKQSLKPFLNSDHQRALILGNGGAAKAVRFVLDSYGIPYLIVSRSPQSKDEIGWDQVNEFVIKYHQLIINTTPLGTFPNNHQKPEIPYNELTSKHFLYDLTYNPLETEFMRQGKRYGALAINGLSMLQHQADRAWEIWQGNQ